MFVVSKPRGPATPLSLTSIAKECRHLRSILSRAYLNVSDCVTHIWPIPMLMVCNDIPRDIPKRDPPRIYVLSENRASIQSLALMRSAINTLPLQLGRG